MLRVKRGLDCDFWVGFTGLLQGDSRSGLGFLRARVDCGVVLVDPGQPGAIGGNTGNRLETHVSNERTRCHVSYELCPNLNRILFLG